MLTLALVQPVVPGCDLAAATGQSAGFDDETVPVSGDATPLEQLLAASGRPAVG